MDQQGSGRYRSLNMSAAIATYPDFQEQVRELVRQHRKVKKRQLRLAVYLAPAPRGRRDSGLFEVIDGFGGNEVDERKKLFEFAYGSTPGFTLPPKTSLLMVLTNPPELVEAVRDNWKGVEKLRAARDSGRATVIYADAEGKKLWDSIK